MKGKAESGCKVSSWQQHQKFATIIIIEEGGDQPSLGIHATQTFSKTADVKTGIWQHRSAAAATAALK